MSRAGVIIIGMWMSSTLAYVHLVYGKPNDGLPFYGVLFDL